jgi:hypothetical protein
VPQYTDSIGGPFPTASTVQSLASDGKLKVFISYSRADMAFADELVGGLEMLGFEVSIDRHSIAEGEEWKARLGALIADADTVVFVISPTSVSSPICAWEVEEAHRFSKRILPVLCQPVADGAVPPRLSALNYIRFDTGHSFIAGLRSLATALRTNLAWLREHGRILGLARYWEAGGRPHNRLLSGSDVTAARAWLSSRPIDAPEPTELHLDYIRTSEQGEADRTNAERKRLETLAAAEAERANALASAEQAQRERAEASKRVVQRTVLGLVVAALLATGAVGAMLVARQETERARAAEGEVRAANARLSAQMKLRVALRGDRVDISENWYKLATTNAASVVRLLSNEDAVASGLLVRGRDLHPAFGDEVFVVTAEHVLHDFENFERDSAVPRRRWATIPAVDPDRKIAVKEIVWRSRDTYESGVFYDLSLLARVDTVILRLGERPPATAVPVVIPETYDIAGWATIGNPNDIANDAKSPASLLSISYVHNLGLTLSLSSATGKFMYGGVATKVFYTDASGQGSSGAPVFDANTGVLVAFEQVGQDGKWAGGVPILTVREAIRHSMEGKIFLPSPPAPAKSLR